jgi:predicted 2-oxoglutarate/Fe(II)-dependent dioxygenase YbiX
VAAVSAQPAEVETRFDIGAGPGAAGMSLAEWSRKKNANKGPPVSGGVLWSMDENVDFTAAPLDGATEGLPGMLIRGALTAAECEALIAGIPSDGPGVMKGDEVGQNYRDRVVTQRYQCSDEALAKRLEARLAAYLPRELDGGRLLGLNSGFRFIHYVQGGRHGPHIDGREPVEPDSTAEGFVQSRITLQAYLNGDFSGGEFTLVDVVGSEFAPRQVIKPQRGDVVLFYQERLDPPQRVPYKFYHQGSDVTAGNKYTCRTMVDYVFSDATLAKHSNSPDNAA